VLATREPDRLYSGLSVLVSTAVDGAPCAALASFGSLELLLEGEPPLTELIDTALELDTLTIHACSAAVSAGKLERAEIEARLDGIKSTPRFLRDTAGAQLIFV
jgi:hypothetical protein